MVDAGGLAFGGFGPAGGGVVHGQLTVPKSGGGYQTVDVQRGTVVATVTGSTATASIILDLSAIKAGRAAFDFPGRAYPSNLKPAPLPAQPPSA